MPHQGCYTRRMAVFVLVHGMFHGGWCWSRVATGLRARGHRVLHPTLTGLGERAHLMSRDITVETHTLDILGVLEAEELRDVVLVGHSFAGTAITMVADRKPEVLRRLIYLDSSLLRPGECSLDRSPPEIAAARRAAAAETGGLSVAPPEPTLFGIPPGPDADWVRRRLTPQPFATLTSPLGLLHPHGNGVPRSYVACIGASFPGIGYAWDIARTEPGWDYHELPAGHDSMITAAPATMAILERLTS